VGDLKLFADKILKLGIDLWMTCLALLASQFAIK